MKTLFLIVSALLILVVATNEVRAQKAGTVNLAAVWHGEWADFSVSSSGDFVKEGTRYRWIGSRPQLPKRAGCWAFYDGITSKSDWVVSFKRAKSDAESKRNLAQLSNDRFKVVTLACTERNGQEIEDGGDCIHSGYIYDEGSIYEPITCQFDVKFEIEFRKIKKR